MISITNYMRDKIGPCAVSAVDEGAGTNAILEIWTAPRPANPTISGGSGGATLLTQLPFSDPAFGNWAGGISHGTINGSSDVIASGVASWFRITNKDGVGLIDGDISLRGGTGDLQFDNINFIESGVVTITRLEISVPVSC